MTNQSWPKEPWGAIKIKENKSFIVNGNLNVCDKSKLTNTIFSITTSSDVNFDSVSRIVSCVNALAGIEDPEAFVKEAKLAIELNKEAQRLTEGFSEEDREWFKEQGEKNNEK